MPTPAENHLWELVAQRKFEDIKPLIEQTPALLQATKDGQSLLIYLIRNTRNKTDKPRGLLLFLLTHPEMDWNFEYNKKPTAHALIDAFSIDRDSSVIEGLKDTPGFFLNQKHLTYNFAADFLNKVTTLLKNHKDTNKPQKDIDRTQESIIKWEKIVSLIRDMTILHAIKNDRTDLLELLEKSGGKPLEQLGEFGNNERLMQLADRDSPVYEWGMKQRVKQHEEHSREAAKHLNHFSFLQAASTGIIVESQRRAAEILQRAAENRIERIEDAIQKSPNF